MEEGVKELHKEQPRCFDASVQAAYLSTAEEDAVVVTTEEFDRKTLLVTKSIDCTNDAGTSTLKKRGIDGEMVGSPGDKFIRQTKSLSAKFLVNIDQLLSNVAGVFDEAGSVLRRPSSHSLRYTLPLTSANLQVDHDSSAAFKHRNLNHKICCTDWLGNGGNPTSQPPPGYEDATDSSSCRTIQLEPALPICLKFEDVKYKVAVKGGKHLVSEKFILHGISGSVHPGEVLALMGPSGGGKTTLLNILSGRVKINSGTITYNDQPYTKSLKRRIGYVLQDDVAFPHLTVKETLTYSALLRLPNTLTTQQKKERAMNVITDLGLERCQDTVIGSTFVRGISGGERKRVCIGNEILLNPSLLFLDEPTSGLDSTTALRIVQMLHNIAKAGTTIVTTIHQPSSRLFSKFDKLILLGKGNSLYFGKASEAMVYFSSIGCSPLIAMNPAEFLIDLANGNINDKSVPSELQDKLLTRRKSIDVRSGGLSPVDVHEYLKCAYEAREVKIDKKKLLKPKNQGGSCSIEKGASWWEQFLVLSRRGLKQRRHEYLSCIRVVQVISTAIIIGLLWWHSDASSPPRLEDQAGLLFFISVFWGFLPLFTAIFTFPQERAMLVKERSVDMYQLSAYLLARNISDLPLDLVLPMVFLLIVYFMVGLKLSFTAFIRTLLTVFLSVVAAQGLGLSIGAAFMDIKKATTLASIVLMTFMLSGGFFIQRVPPFMAWLRYTSFNYHTYRLLLKIQYSFPRSVTTTDTHIYEYPFFRGLKLDSVGTEVGAMMAMVIGYRFLAYFFLRRMKVITSK